jgi:hypothetical protein
LFAFFWNNMKEVIDYFDSGNKRQWVRLPIVNSLMVVRTILLCLMSLGEWENNQIQYSSHPSQLFSSLLVIHGFQCFRTWVIQLSSYPAIGAIQLSCYPAIQLSQHCLVDPATVQYISQRYPGYPAIWAIWAIQLSSYLAIHLSSYPTSRLAGPDIKAIQLSRYPVTQPSSYPVIRPSGLSGLFWWRQNRFSGARCDSAKHNYRIGFWARNFERVFGSPYFLAASERPWTIYLVGTTFASGN